MASNRKVLTPDNLKKTLDEWTDILKQADLLEKIPLAVDIDKSKLPAGMVAGNEMFTGKLKPVILIDQRDLIRCTQSFVLNMLMQSMAQLDTSYFQQLSDLYLDEIDREIPGTFAAIPGASVDAIKRGINFEDAIDPSRIGSTRHQADINSLERNFSLVQADSQDPKKDWFKQVCLHRSDVQTIRNSRAKLNKDLNDREGLIGNKDDDEYANNLYSDISWMYEALKNLQARESLLLKDIRRTNLGERYHEIAPPQPSRLSRAGEWLAKNWKSVLLYGLLGAAVTTAVIVITVLSMGGAAALGVGLAGLYSAVGGSAGVAGGAAAVSSAGAVAGGGLFALLKRTLVTLFNRGNNQEAAVQAPPTPPAYSALEEPSSPALPGGRGTATILGPNGLNTRSVDYSQQAQATKSAQAKPTADNARPTTRPDSVVTISRSPGK